MTTAFIITGVLGLLVSFGFMGMMVKEFAMAKDGNTVAASIIVILAILPIPIFIIATLVNGGAW